MSDWTTFEAGIEGFVMIAPTHVAAKWKAESSDKVRIFFTYWGGLEYKLPKEIRPSGDKLTPHLLVDNMDAANKTIAQLKAFVEERYPDIKQNKQKELIRWESGKHSFWVSTYPDDESDHVFTTCNKGLKAYRYLIGGDPDFRTVMWSTGPLGEAFVRVTDDEVLFVPSEDFKVSGKGTSHGQLSFADGVVVALPIGNALTALKGVTSPKDLKKLVANKPIAVVGGTKRDKGKAAIAAVTKGDYVVTTGGNPSGSWVKLARV